MWHPKRTLIECLASISTKNIGAGIYYIDGDTKSQLVTYKELWEMSKRILGYLQNHGVKPGHEVILQMDTNQDLLPAFWACMLGGAIPVPISLSNSDNIRQKVLNIFPLLKNPWLISSKGELPGFQEYAGQTRQMETLFLIRKTALSIDDMKEYGKDGIVVEARPEDIAFIQFSSGSTGLPKGVVLTHQNLIRNIEGIVNSSEMAVTSRFLSWTPLTHDMGMIGFHLMPLCMNTDQHHIPTNAFVMHPTLWMKKVHEHRINIISSPNFGLGFFLNHYRRERAKEWDLSCVYQLYNGAEPISASLCRRFSEEMEPYGFKKNAMYTVYGLAEASLCVTVPEPRSELRSVIVDRRHLSIGDVVQIGRDVRQEHMVEFVVEGRAIINCEVTICDEQGAKTNDGVVGAICIRGSNVTQGYYNDPEATIQLINTEGWLNTGDLGFTYEGELVVTGRHKDILFVNGQNYYPQDLETIIEEIDNLGIGKAAVCGVFDSRNNTEEIVAFLCHKNKFDAFLVLAEEVKQRVYQKTGLSIKDVVPIFTLPKTTSGKIKRYLLKEQYETRVFDSILEKIAELKRMQNKTRGEKQGVSTAMHKSLLEIFAEIIGYNDITIDDNFFDFGANSLILTRALDMIDRLYPQKVVLANLFAFPSVRKLAAFLNQDLPKLKGNPLSQRLAVEQAGEPGEYTLELPVETRAKIVRVAQAHGLTQEEVVVAGLGLTIADACARDCAQIYVADDYGQVMLCSLTLSDLKDLKMLLTRVKDAPRAFDSAFSLERLPQMSGCGSKEISCLFSTARYRMVHTFDIAVCFDIAQHETLLLRHSSKLAKATMLEFSQTYAHVIEQLAQLGA